MGQLSKPIALVRHSMVVGFAISVETTMLALCNNETFAEKLRMGIAAAMTEVAATWVQESDVESLSLDACVPTYRRRLRRLSANATNVTLDYDVRLENETVARQVVSSLEDAKRVATFLDNFTVTLQSQALFGVSVRALAASTASLVVKYVSVPMVTQAIPTAVPTPAVPPPLPTKAPQIPVDDEVLITIGVLVLSCLGFALVCLVRNMYKMQLAKAERMYANEAGEVFKYHNTML